MTSPDRKIDDSIVDLEADPIYQTAADWIVRLQDPNVSLEDTLAWQSWMKANARHTEAFTRLEEVSRLVRKLRAPQQPTATELARDDYDGSTTLSAWTATRNNPRSRSLYALALAASIALVAIGIAYFSPAATVVSTAVGENRTILLDDGSKVVLGGNTQLTVAMSKDTRSIDLSRGEAFFTVAKERTRPFKVHAGDATVIAVGTEFNVRRAHDRSFVSVVEGRVIVEPTSRLMPTFVLRELRPKLRPVHIDAGQQTTAGSAGIELASAIDDPTAVTSWQNGRLAYRLQPLRYVLEDVNRYAPKPIVIENDRIGDLVITGTVTSDNIKGWVSSLERGFNLVSTDEPDRIVLRPRY